MKKSFVFSISLFILSSATVIAQTNIADARSGSIGATVTVKGIVTNGSELGPIRYLQDNSAGIAVYSSSLSNTKRGDSISVTGALSDYNQLLEISPVTNFTVISSGNNLPVPVVLTPSQLSDNYEAQLVRIEHAVFADAGKTFTGKTNYNFIANGQDGEIRISDNASPLVGKVIPSGEVTITGALGQYFSTYQVLPRDENDVVASSSINLTTPVTVGSITTTGFVMSWGTDVTGTSELKYGNTPALELGSLPSSGNGTTHTYAITGRTASEILYIRAFSVNGSDTAKSTVGTYITASNSTGNIKTYFNRTVDPTVSTGTDAIQLDHAIDDTLIKYIERAQETIDFTIYNFNNSGITNISAALNAAYSRGVVIRVIYDSDQGNLGIAELNAGIGKLADPIQGYPTYGIMHNKFLIFDAKSTDPNLPIVWTGSTNLTDGQINTDANNVIIIQDQSLAKNYTLEFEEMFGSTGPQPDLANSKFGPDKTDNTAHEFMIGGHRVESYFSPSDGTNSKILASINSADQDLSVAAMLITRNELGYAIRDRVNAGVTGKVLVNSDSDPSMATVKATLESALGTNFRKTGESGIMHHKYLIVDNSAPASDPLVLTGSHNWSSSAEYRNDENTLIVHDATVVNQYYQEFTSRFNNGQLIVDAPDCVADYVNISQGDSVIYEVVANDHIPGPISLTISSQPNHGIASVPDASNIKYVPDASFAGLDTITYKVCLSASPDLCDSTWMVVWVQEPNGINPNTTRSVWNIYPNPVFDRFTLTTEQSEAMEISIKIFDLSGKLLKSYAPEITSGSSNYTFDVSDLTNGVYLVKFSTANETGIKKLVIRR